MTIVPDLLREFSLKSRGLARYGLVLGLALLPGIASLRAEAAGGTSVNAAPPGTMAETVAATPAEAVPVTVTSQSGEAKPLPGPDAIKILTIGNSFAEDSTAFLPEMAAAGGREVVIFRANLAGHSLQQHADYITKAAEDPNYEKARPYTKRKNPFTGETKNWNLREALECAPWDYVTIQQASFLSYVPESFEPYGGMLVEYIRKYAPSAQILVHQTWSYRVDNAYLTKNNLTREAMFEGIEGAYAKLASTYQLPLVPVGAAFQKAASLERYSRLETDPDFDYKNPVEGTFPQEPVSIYVGWSWRLDRKLGKKVFYHDAKHASKTGRYLGASVFHHFLFGEGPDLSFLPKGVEQEDAEIMRGIAAETVQRYKSEQAAVSPKAAAGEGQKVSQPGS